MPYGLTETGTMCGMLYNKREVYDPSGVGFLFPGVQIRLQDSETGTEFADLDTPREILAQTPGLLMGLLPAARGHSKRSPGQMVRGRRHRTRELCESSVAHHRAQEVRLSR